MRLTLKIWRQAGPRATGRFVTYPMDGIEPDVSFLEMLDILNQRLILQGEEPIAFDNDCREGICGSCGMMIDGEPKLACKAFVRNYEGVIRVEPLAHFPIERDLVTVVDDFMAKLKRVKPYLIPKQEKPVSEGEYRQSPAELKRFKQYSMCINCMLCYAACPEYGLIPKYIGPAAIALAHRYNQDSRDGGRAERQEEIATTEGVWECSFTGACSEVCPEHVDPAAALQQVKIRSTVDWYAHHLMPWLKK